MTSETREIPKNEAFLSAINAPARITVSNCYQSIVAAVLLQLLTLKHLHWEKVDGRRCHLPKRKCTKCWSRPTVFFFFLHDNHCARKHAFSKNIFSINFHTYTNAYISEVGKNIHATSNNSYKETSFVSEASEVRGERAKGITGCRFMLLWQESLCSELTLRCYQIGRHRQ